MAASTYAACSITKEHQKAISYGDLAKKGMGWRREFSKRHARFLAEYVERRPLWQSSREFPPDKGGHKVLSRKALSFPAENGRLGRLRGSHFKSWEIAGL
jgi:hypothetical protein